MKIKRDDPRRRHLHDYFLVDSVSGADVVGFSTQAEALAYGMEHLRGKFTWLQVVHPDGCGCTSGQVVYPDGVTPSVN